MISDGIDYNLSQYAVDNSLISNGSPKSMEGILWVLNYFADLSGLKFITQKLKWIECKMDWK